jgi:hypothetical protein
LLSFAEAAATQNVSGRQREVLKVMILTNRELDELVGELAEVDAQLAMPRSAVMAHPDACLPIEGIARRVRMFCSVRRPSS